MSYKRKLSKSARYNRRPLKVISVAQKAKLQRARSGIPKVIVAASDPMMKQLRGLLAAKTRDALDVYRNATAGGGVSRVSLLTSSSPFTTAAAATGILDADADEVLINSVRIAGYHDNQFQADTDPVGNFPTFVRVLVVWMTKPLLIASAAGTLPTVTEVLTAASIDAMPIQSQQNGGRFTILSDRRWNLGLATTSASVSTTSAQSMRQFFDYTIKVGRRCKFVTPAASGAATAGGHYGTGAATGQLSTGLLLMYSMAVGPAGLNTNVNFATRVNYTG
ncbi:putative capsid protein [McMurdo Ice Shelf pond-associated circular DNA virus-6]|uniref:putative capsid protein n=1 Tax=McMurdo Ice Shelf pond-associated circular DNA virus-6 TaxID=1521390 RepID=UPI0004D1BE6B|nr:putative capsid protein [McMurdo Ice Shelf pond-associated circular DNA virus-6]AIF71515.1 putative capsid protein [McMurdo Ice Shelf pond-associated circular DNA virus-6]